MMMSEQLNIDALPRGITHLRVKLGENPLGEPLAIPVMVAKGKPGPTLGITAALHGNEINGIRVIHNLFSKIDCKTLKGTVVGVLVANPTGFLTRSRLFLEHRDLNHLMPGQKVGRSSDVWAYRLLENIVEHFDYLVDLHTASTGRVNTLYVRADMHQEISARMAYVQRPRIILHNPPNEGTLRDAAIQRGIPAITVEIGDPQLFQKELIKRSTVGLRAILAELGFTANKPIAAGKEPIVCDRSEWLYTEHGGLLDLKPKLAEVVHKGEGIGRITNIYGETIQQLHAPQNGIVIGKSVDPVSYTGARIMHLGHMVPATSVLPRDITRVLRPRREDQ